MYSNLSIVADDKEGKVSIKIRNDNRVETMCNLLLDSGLWVRKCPTVFGEKYVWIDIQIPKEKSTNSVSDADDD